MSGEISDLNTTITEQSQTIKTLADSITNKATEGEQPVFMAQEEKDAPNYLLYIGIGAILFLLLKRS